MIDQLVAEFEVGRAGTVRASLSTYRGVRRLDLRLWVQPRQSPGAPLIPTAKGLNVPIEFADELLEAATALWAAAKQASNELGQRRARELLEAALAEPLPLSPREAVATPRGRRNQTDGGVPQ